MKKIDQKYLDDSVRIRQTYKECLFSLKEKEDKVKIYRDSITELMDEMKSYIENTPDENFNENTQKLLNDKLIDIESNINLIKKEIVPINTTIESLKKQSSNLYSVISESYPSLSMEEIQRQVINYLTKNNLL